jgi:hypothetical protein
MTRDFVFARARRMGRGYARMLHNPSDKPKLNLPFLRYIPHHVRQIIRFGSTLVGSPQEKIRKEWEYNINKGYHEHLKELFGRY